MRDQGVRRQAVGHHLLEVRVRCRHRRARKHRLVLLQQQPCDTTPRRLPLLLFTMIHRLLRHAVQCGAECTCTVRRWSHLLSAAGEQCYPPQRFGRCHGRSANPQGGSQPRIHALHVKFKPPSGCCLLMAVTETTLQKPHCHVPYPSKQRERVP